MAKKRKSRAEVDSESIDLLKPLDLMSLGGEDDPCFGKLHSLKAPECLTCGDSEFCSIVMAQNLHKQRLAVESGQQMKDLDEAEGTEIKKKKEARVYMLDLLKKNYKRMKIVLLTAEKFNLTKDKVKEIYNEI